MENAVIEPGHDDEPVALCHEMVQPDLGVDVQVLLGRPQPGGAVDRRPARPDDKDLDQLVQGGEVRVSDVCAWSNRRPRRRSNASAGQSERHRRPLGVLGPH